MMSDHKEVWESWSDIEDQVSDDMLAVLRDVDARLSRIERLASRLEALDEHLLRSDRTNARNRGDLDATLAVLGRRVDYLINKVDGDAAAKEENNGNE